MSNNAHLDHGKQNGLIQLKPDELKHSQWCISMGIIVDRLVIFGDSAILHLRGIQTTTKCISNQSKPERFIEARRSGIQNTELCNSSRYYRGFSLPLLSDGIWVVRSIGGPATVNECPVTTVFCYWDLPPEFDVFDIWACSSCSNMLLGPEIQAESKGTF